MRGPAPPPALQSEPAPTGSAGVQGAVEAWGKGRAEGFEAHRSH